MNPKCDLCGRDMVERNDTGAFHIRRWFECPATPDQHRIAELEKQVAELEAEIEARGPVAVTKRMTPEGERIVELERQLEEAKLTVYQREVRIETMDAENNRLWNQKNSALSERDEALTALREMAESATAERNACSEKQCEIGRLSAQLRAREADMLALRGHIETIHKNAKCQLTALDALNAPFDSPLYKNARGVRSEAIAALSSTSATAQEIVARIEREAVEFIWKKASSCRGIHYPKVPCLTCYTALDEIRKFCAARILGEKEKP